ncbi:MAG TPA: YggS family pyridoxal phosphate-dependent enzyme [Leptolinea sp.]
MLDSQELIKTSFEDVQTRLEQAVLDSGRTPESVRLLVVTKGQPTEKIQFAYQAGARLFGENYPEETLDKIEQLRNLDGIEFHMIGHLQSRKAKIIATAFNYMHSIDRVSIAEKLNTELLDAKRKLPILLEMNVSGEASKNGFPAWEPALWDNLLASVEQISAFTSLQIHGLMTMPPLTADQDAVRPYFKKLRELRDFLAMHFPLIKWSELSMGTSADFEIAVQEGATFIRVGTAIMGPRPPRIS